MPGAGRARRRCQTLEIVRHVALNTNVDAQVFAQIEDELETQRVVAVAHEERRPRNRPRFGEFELLGREHLSHRATVERAVPHVPRCMDDGENRLVAIAHDRRNVQAASVGLDERAAFVRRPVRFLDVERAAIPHVQQHPEQAVPIAETESGQMLEQQREALFGFEPEVRLPARAARLEDVRAPQRPRQDRLRAEQVAHADRARQIRREHQLARFEKLLGGRAELLDSGDALPARKIRHGRREVSGSAVHLPRAPGEPDLRPAPLACMAERAERTREIRHEAFERAPRAAPAREFERLLRPWQHGFGYALRFHAAANESAAGFAVEVRERPARAEPRENDFLAVRLDRRNGLLDVLPRGLTLVADAVQQVAYGSCPDRVHVEKCAWTISISASASSMSSVIGLIMAT